jgi:hypothetical protein
MSTTIDIPLTDDSTREEVEAFCIKQIAKHAKLDFDLDMFELVFDPDTDDYPYTINIWGPTDLDGLCPLVATIHTFNRTLVIE